MNVDRTTLFGTAAHAAVTALTVAAAAYADPVRCQNARAVYGLIASSDSGEPAAARRRAGAVVALTADAADTDPGCAALVLAFERWLLHPGRDSSRELTAAAAEYVDGAPEELCRRAWLAGAGIEIAAQSVTRGGLRAASPEVLSLIGAACAQLVPLVWVARRCGVSRDGLYRRIRSVGADSWQEMLAGPQSG